ncbi:hypothetical protein EVAR_79908_1 [Eumeta japonica]|uniref:Uncharacterized protein n=1 Tax=Eumeta variegata TaxID=151549 RepID=A0A4C1TZF2_EUMVA|nr:hypothetical protein EVAR_79908_1 [Eumeta japonica]
MERQHVVGSPCVARAHSEHLHVGLTVPQCECDRNKCAIKTHPGEPVVTVSNMLVTPLWMRVSVDGDDYLLSDDSRVRLHLEMNRKKDEVLSESDLPTQ